MTLNIQNAPPAFRSPEERKRAEAEAIRILQKIFAKYA